MKLKYGKIVVLFLGIAFSLSGFGMSSRLALNTAENSYSSHQYNKNKLMILTVLEILKQYYVDANRINNHIIVESLLSGLGEISSKIKINRKNKEVYRVSFNKISFLVNSYPSDSDLVDFCNGLVEELEYAFSENYFSSDLKIKNVTHFIINIILNRLDPHTMLLSKKDYEQIKEDTQGVFGGIGVVVGIRDYSLTVIKPIKKSPAHRAGIREKDKILSVDGQLTWGLSLDQMVSLMRGAPGSSVQLSVVGEGDVLPRHYNITREIIKINPTQDKYLSYKGKTYLYLKVEHFSIHTAKDIKNSVHSYYQKNNGIDGVVLDLRGNPGGLLSQAVKVSDIFLNKGKIVETKGHIQETEYATPSWLKNDFPLTVMLDESSASASEIVAGALQDHGRAVIVGRRSFGKGSVQTIFELPDNNAIKMTIARYYTPKDYSIQGRGIIPDVIFQPVNKNNDNINLFGDFRYRVESAMRFSLQPGAKDDYSHNSVWYRVYYLKDKEDEKDLERHLAVKILHAIPKNQAIKSKLKTLIKDKVIAFDKKLSFSKRAFSYLRSKHKIKWKNKFLEVKKKLKIKVLGWQEKSGKLYIKYKIQNPNKVDVDRVSIFVRPHYYNILTTEFLLGRVPKNSSVIREVELVSPKFSQDTEFLLDVGVSINGKVDKRSRRNVFVTLEKKNFTNIQSPFWLIKDGLSSKIDGVIESNEQAILKIYVKNTGAVNADNVVVELFNFSGSQLFASTIQQQIATILPGEETVIEVPLIGGKKMFSETLSLGVLIKSDSIKIPYQTMINLKAEGSL
jgi:carboxyl-terminal processing protease